MEDTFSLIYHACELALHLQNNLPNLASNPHSLLTSTENVTRAFEEAIHLLRSRGMSPQERSSHGGDGYFQAMGHHHGQSSGEPNPLFFHGQLERDIGLSVMDVQDLDGLGLSGFGDRAVAVPATAECLADTSRRPAAGSSVQGTSRRRKVGIVEYTVRVPLPRTGSTEMPPDDHYTWRKYGQKAILGSKFPRSYYRCTHRNFYGCQAKKQVQRLDDDPYTYEVTYRGRHTCQTSTTPLILPSLPTTTDNQLPSPSTIPDMWFPILEIQARESSGAAHAGPSSAQEGRDADFPVTELADAMFNSGSSGSSMDAIFSIKHEYWKDKHE